MVKVKVNVSVDEKNGMQLRVYHCHTHRVDGMSIEQRVDPQAQKGADVR